MKALWAFEPFHQDTTRTKGMQNTLRQLAGSSSNIEVGFIVTRTEGELSQAFDVPAEERFSTYPKKLTEQALRKAKVPIEHGKIHVVDYPTLSNTQAVDKLLGLAKSRNADLIAMYTHSRKGFARLVLGSFAETAIHRSKVSLLLVNPKCSFSKTIKSIFFASDFTPASKKHLKRTLLLCRQVRAKLTVFHQTEIIYKWSMDESNPEIHAYRRKVNRMQAWIEQECQRSGVPCTVIVKSEFSATSDLIIQTAAKTKADLIVVAAKSGPTAALMGGSITRHLVRGSNKPVLILK